MVAPKKSVASHFLTFSKKKFCNNVVGQLLVQWRGSLKRVFFYSSAKKEREREMGGREGERERERKRERERERERKNERENE
jgi:hypothetical protein